MFLGGVRRELRQFRLGFCCMFGLNSGCLLCSKVMTTMDSGITNGLEIYENASGAAQIVASNNDNVVRLLDAEQLTVCG